MTTSAKTQPVILITGASTGIGSYLVTYYLSRNYKVLATARNDQDLAQLQELGAHAIFCELADQESIKSCVSEVLSLTDKIDCLVNNAAFGQAGAVIDLSYHDLKYQFDVNVFGTFELARLLLPLVELSEAGKVIFVSSILGVVTSPYIGAYSASKYALESLVSALRMEKGDSQVHFTTIRPGLITTRFRDTAEKFFKQNIEKKQGVDLSKYDRFVKRSVLKQQKNRVRSPELVAKVVDRIIKAKRPRCAYYVTPEAHFMGRLQRFIPLRLVEWIMCKFS
jgi:short-subunit dehydrogenase